MRRRLAGVGLTFLCALFGAVAADQPPGQLSGAGAAASPGGVPSPAGPTTGKISGRVLAADSGRPIRRARVLLNGPGLPNGRAIMTDDAGLFEFAELPTGRFTLTASKEGFINISYGQRRPLQPGTPISLQPGEELLGLDIRLPRGGVVSGRIYDETGEPMVGATVRLMRYQYAQGARTLMPAGTGRTDDRGQYRIWGLNPGDYYVSAAPSANGLLRPALEAARAAIEARGGQRVVIGRGELPDTFTFSAGAGGPFATAVAGPMEGNGYTPTYFPGVSSPADAQPVTVGVGAEVLEISFGVLAVPTARVTGRVITAEGSAASSGQVMLVPDVQGGNPSPMGLPLGAGVDREGAFTVLNVPPGRYLLRASSGGRGRGGRQGVIIEPQFGMLPVAVTGDVTDLQLTLSYGSTLAGSVRLEATQSPTLPDVRQFRVSLPLADFMSIGPTAAARMNTDGTFTLGPVPAGLHVIRAAAPRGWTLKSAEWGGRDVIDSPLEVRPGERMPPLSLVFTDKLSEINGTVVETGGSPLPEYTVLAFPTDPALWRPQSRHIMTTRPDQNGRYQLRGLPAGEYYLATIDPAEPGEWFEPSYLERQRAAAVRVRLGEGDARTQDFRLALR
jgi:hypothetical protein